MRGQERKRLGQFFKTATECLIKKLDFTLRKEQRLLNKRRSPVLEKNSPVSIKRQTGKGNGNARQLQNEDQQWK